MDIDYSNYYRLFSMVTNPDMINQHILMYKFLQYLQNHYKVIVKLLTSASEYQAENFSTALFS